MRYSIVLRNKRWYVLTTVTNRVVFSHHDKTAVENWLDMKSLSRSKTMYVVTWTIREEGQDELIDVFGPFSTEQAATEWTDHVKNQPKYADAILMIAKLANPSTLL